MGLSIPSGFSAVFFFHKKYAGRLVMQEFYMISFLLNNPFHFINV